MSKRGVAQPGSAPVLGTGGRRFESCRPDYFLSLKPLAKHKRGVAQPGSAPVLGTGGRRFESCRPRIRPGDGFKRRISVSKDIFDRYRYHILKTRTL